MSAYFMDGYNVVISDSMIDNLMQTETQETLGLLTLKQFIYLALPGALPSFLIYKSKLVNHPSIVLLLLG